MAPACRDTGLRLRLALIALAGCRESPPRGPDPVGPPAALVAVDPSTLGISFVNRVADPCDYRLPDITGSGIAIADLDGDGRLDLVVASLSQSDAVGPRTGGSVSVYLQSADGRYGDRGRLALDGTPMGIAVGDLTNDALPEILVTAYGDDRLYLNEGEGRFRDVTEACGYSNPAWGTSACFLDYDRDGWLDLFVTNYVDYRHRPCRRSAGGARDFCGPHLFEGTIDRLYRNASGDAADARGAAGREENPSARLPRLIDVTAASGIATARGAGLGVTACDLTGDGLSDIYVANDQMANVLWVNRGDGTFRDEAVLRGCAYDMRGRPQGSMGVAVDDFDDDGQWDIFLTHLAGEYHTLYRGRPDGSFEDDTATCGLARPTLPLTGFGVAAVDLDHDGDSDLVSVSGGVRRPASAGMDTGSESTAECLSAYREPGQVLWNASGRFAEAACAGSALCEPAISRGLAVGDLDGDGDQDVAVNRTAAPPLILRNDQPKTGAWVRVRATLPRSGGRDAVGAVVTVITDRSAHRRPLQPGMGYLGSSDARVHVGLGPAERIERIDVTWPDGSRSSHAGGPVNRDMHIAQPSPNDHPGTDSP